jgi:hypothetical protein
MLPSSDLPVTLYTNSRQDTQNAGAFLQTQPPQCCINGETNEESNVDAPEPPDWLSATTGTGGSLF